MKTVVLASLLATAGAAPLALNALAQPQQGSGIQMQPDEYAKYQTCSGGQAGAAQAQACQDYLKAYPNSVVKKDVLQTIMFDYVQANDNKDLIPAADALLAVDPKNLFADVFEAQARSQTGDMAGAASYAQKGIALGQPSGLPDQQFAAVKAQGYPVMYSAIANNAAASGDQATAITNFKLELAAVPVDATTKPGLQLQDTYGLAQAYYKSTPPDYIDCAYYAARGAYYAPDQFKPTFTSLARYCYQKYHGTAEGFDAVTPVAKDNLNPPASFTITPAPKPADIVSQLLATTPDKATLAPGDREYVLLNGTPEQQAAVFDPVKGKVAKFPDITVLSATDTKVLCTVSDDAVQNKTADFEWDMKTPLKTVPAAGATITLIGTYTSYTVNSTANPPSVLIVMSDAEVATKAPAHTTPAHRTTHR